MRRARMRGVQSPSGIAYTPGAWEPRAPILSLGYAVCRQQPPTQRKSIKCQVKGRKTSHMKGQQSAKHFGMLAKSLQSALLNPGPPVESEHQPRHPQRAPGQPPVCQLILREFAGNKTLRQHDGLVERKSETVARDRVDSAGSIADQGDIFSPDAPQFAIGRHRAFLRRNYLSAAKACFEFRKHRQRLFKAESRVARGHSYTHTIRTHGGGIALAAFSPINLHAIGPRGDAIVPPKGVSQAGSRAGIEIRPAANPGVRPIGTYNPSAADCALS